MLPYHTVGVLQTSGQKATKGTATGLLANLSWMLSWKTRVMIARAYGWTSFALTKNLLLISRGRSQQWMSYIDRACGCWSCWKTYFSMNRKPRSVRGTILSRILRRTRDRGYQQQRIEVHLRVATTKSMLPDGGRGPGVTMSSASMNLGVTSGRSVRSITRPS